MTTAIAGRRRLRPFLRHLAEMIVAMTIGMIVLGPLWPLPAAAAARPEVAAFVMATDMSIAMAVWMWHRGHSRAATAEMVAAMYLPYLVMLVPWWAGLIPAEAVVAGGHVLMLPAMVLAMLRRADEYQGGHLPAARTGARSHLLARWPAALALAMSVDNMTDPRGMSPWTMLILPVGYLVIGGVRRTLRPRRVLLRQVAGLLGYLLLAAAAFAAGPAAGAFLVGAGWLAHSAWDIWHHRTGEVVPRPYAEWCAVLDAVLGLSVIVYALTL